jgi:hypothetical protein
MSYGLGLNDPPSSVSPTQSLNLVTEQKVRWLMALKNASGWFIWVAGLSLLNSVLYLSGVRFQFIFGLGFAQLVDVLARRIGGLTYVLDFIINGFLIGVFVVFWNFARTGKRWALVAGMSIYALDGLLMLALRSWLGVAFHAFALFSMYGGLTAISKLREIEQADSPGMLRN